MGWPDAEAKRPVQIPCEGCEFQGRSSGLASGVARRLGETWAVQPVGPRIACQLATEHRRRALELAGDRPQAPAFLPPEISPHSALQWMTTAEFARQARKSASPDNSTK
ncbi:hypothetical protein X997_4040 [Burkholderia pseudomallei A79C]|nr:hypothetical protein X997_4040 [Burkholderia pseudomallei A79C]